MFDPVGLAKGAYHAYGETTGFKNFRGEPMPEWDDLGDTIQRAWIAAASAVRLAVEVPAATEVLAATTPLGTLQISITPQGAFVLDRADQSIAVSVELLRQIEGPELGGCVSRRDGLIVFTTINPDGRPVEVVYREAGFDPTAEPDANEGGFLLLEREPG